MWTIASYSLASLAMLLIVAGLMVARDRRRHIPLMLAAFAADVIGLVVIQFIAPAFEDKVDPVSGLMEHDSLITLPVIHAAFSTVSLIGYVFQTVTGRKLMKDRSAMKGHMIGAVIFLLARLGAYVTMWMV